MGQKVNPTGFRVGYTQNWKSRWYNKKDFKKFLKQDTKFREFLSRKLAKAGVDSVEIERTANSVNIIIKTARPGLIIGRGGSGIEQLKEEIKKIASKEGIRPSKAEIRLEVQELRSPESHASVMAQDMAEQIERRMPHRRIIKKGIEMIMQQKEVQGVKIMMKGRLGGAEIARTEWLAQGKIPLQTLRADVDFATATAFTTYGTVGIKVWIYKGDKFEEKKEGKKFES
ncbi:MAG: 30S ribosomal protein S3 [Candidatus Portnoybacteria bacterium]|nr:30S ribosomal protein S3 [Candidatus Portnoybacteria bacterium]